jgi:hypothetical protein
MKEFGGNSKDEQDIADRAKAREIVQSILDYGINQNQIYQMIFLLSMELENHKHTREITDLVKSLKTAKNEKISNIILENKI